ncbi:MAG: SRPBCC family protein [Actinobacteria bacterium]|nr:SRPBCC family protein [Actinomycetota bacterium]
MSRDLSDFGDTIGSALGAVARRATEAASQNGRGRAAHDGPLSGMRGVVAGAAVAAAAPIAAKGAGKAVRNAVGKRVGDPVGAVKDAAGGTVERAAESAKGAVGDVVEQKVDQAGGVPGVIKEAGKQMLTGGGKSKGTPGVGKGRRMPVQQAVDVAVPLEVAYNQWTQFEEWPQFMHRVMQVTQEDDCTVSFKTKMWGMSKQFVAQIVEQRPDERIQWNAGEGVTHTGVVTFHELAPRLTRVQVSLDVEPGSLIEKAARGMRHVKRAVRADLARFKAFIELQEIETGAWRGTIHDGEVVEQHERSYDRGRDYADVDDIQDRESSHAPRRPASAGARSASARRRGSGGRTRSRSDGEHARRPSGRRPRRRRAGASGGR